MTKDMQEETWAAIHAYVKACGGNPAQSNDGMMHAVSAVEESIDKRIEAPWRALPKDGGPAFPHSYADSEYITDGGMTLRDYFAAKAMQASHIADALVSRTGGDDAINSASWTTIAADAYAAADAMLKARASR